MKLALASLLVLALVAPAAAQAPAAPTLFPIRVKGKWGFIDKTGKVKIPAKYDAHAEFENGLAMVTLGGKAGMIDETGKIVVPLEFTWLRPFADDRAPARKGPSECGYLDRTGAWAISYKDCGIDLGSFSEGLAGVTENKKTRFIDPTGKVLFEVPGTVEREFGAGLARIKVGNSPFAINRKGANVALPLPPPIEWFDKNTQLVPSYSTADKKFGFLDATLKFVIDPQFADTKSFSEKRAAVKVGRVWGYIDETGKTVVAPTYDKAEMFSEGLAWVTSSEGLAAIDPSGKVVIPWTDKWESGGEFMHGLAIVRKGRLMGVVDAKGKVIVPLADVQQQNWIWSGDLVGLVDNRGKLYYVNRKGKKVWTER